MMVMPGNNRGAWWGYLACKYPGRIGSICSPQACWKEPVPFAPYAIDNGAFIGFDEKEFLGLLEMANKAKYPPLWVVVPDVVGDKNATIRMWDIWEPRLRPLRCPLAMAMQDGMTPKDFRGDIAFIGGSTHWKWRNLNMWSDVPRFHVGRVNTYRHLWQAHDAGAESCDGTGWFRGGDERLSGLLRYLDESTHGKPEVPELNLTGLVTSA
jgi:hypothetical protein